MENLEPAEREIEALTEKAWQLTWGSNTSGQHLEEDWDTLLSLAKENGWSKKKRGCGQNLEG